MDYERDVLVRDPCTHQNWPNEADWRAWRYTGHARPRSNNPFYSSLLLADRPPPLCPEEGNVDTDGGINVADLIYEVDQRFFDGPAPLPCP